MLTTVLIDDESRARENLHIMLEKHCSMGVRVIGECGNIDEAFVAINTLKPNLVFLDIEMGKGTGFDLLNRFSSFPFKIIFVTAFDQYAIRAIKFCALDYLLKPLSVKDLVQAVDKARAALGMANNEQVQNLIEVFQSPRQKHNRIAIPVQSGFQLLPVNHIVCCIAEKQYTYLCLASGATICSSLNLGEYEELLEGYDFFRVHHSYIVNHEHIKEYIRGEGGEVIMDNNKNIPVSRRKKQEFIDWLTRK